jgi:hypothetical protein
MTVETHWWDTLLIWVSYHDGRFDVRIGAVCLLILVILVWNAVTAFMQWCRGPQITG